MTAFFVSRSRAQFFVYVCFVVVIVVVCFLHIAHNFANGSFVKLSLNYLV